MEINTITITAQPSLPATSDPIPHRTLQGYTVALLAPDAGFDRITVPVATAVGAAVRNEALFAACTDALAVEQPVASRGGSPPRGRQA